MDATQHPTFAIGELTGDSLLIRVLGRSYPGADDFGDGNWLSTMIQFTLGQFQGELSASLRAEEFEAFRDELRTQCSSLRGEAILTSMEEWLALRVSLEGSGRLRIEGVLLDRPSVGNQLRFEIHGLDQSYIPGMIDGLDQIVSAYPVLGAP